MTTANRKNSEAGKLERTTFEESRTKEYFDARELQTMTGQPTRQFAAVILRELVDNGLDAAEKKGVIPKISIRVRHVRGCLHVSVQDNGDGISAETVKRILNFATRTSDKAHYRSPTRGAQGNALKTILGIPYALGCRKPVVIESQGERHFLRPQIDPSGEVSIEQTSAHAPDRSGTRVLVAVPTKACFGFLPDEWAQGFALFNPHALVKIRVRAEEGKQAYSWPVKTGRFYYSPTVRAEDNWRKYAPDEPTSPHWYDSKSLAKLIFGHIHLSRKGDVSKDLTLREFVMSFKGLSGSSNSAAVCSTLPNVKRLTDFEANPKAIEALLEAMQKVAKVLRADALGLVGKEHFRRRFAEWYGEKRFWYEKVSLEVDGIPYIFEVAVAETRKPGKFFHGLNFSPSFEDPLPDTRLAWEDIAAFGLGSFLERTHAHPQSSAFYHTAVAIHLVTPNLVVLDKGKTHVKIPDELAEKIARALWLATKVLFKEEERRRKDAAKQEQADRQRERSESRDLPLTAFMNDVMPAALDHATGGKYRVSTHTLFYSARPEFQKYTDRLLESQYFEHQLLPPYLLEHPGCAKWLYRESRGVLFEPHTGVEVPLGTREVEAYQFPRWRFDKILFIEKTGLWPVFKDSGLAERYDMAIVAGEGVATEACRILFQNAEEGDYQLFSLHDADPYGYNIGRIMREATPRMPGYNVNVCDIGLKLQDALDLGLEPEKASRKKAYPKGLVLTDLEQEYFDGEQVSNKSWVYRRVELNAFTAPQLLNYVETQLHAQGMRGKVVPPKKQLPKLAEPIVRALVGDLVNAQIRRLVSADEIARNLADSFLGTLSLSQSHKWIEQGFSENPLLPWDSVLKSKVDEFLRAKSDDLQGAIVTALREVTRNL